MVEFVVTAEQAKLLSESNGSVEIVDAQGNRLGFFVRQVSELGMQEELEDCRDLLKLRQEKASASTEPTKSLDQVASAR
jgi:hypothetical protein